MNLHRISAEVVFQQWIQGKHGHGYLYHTACFKVIWDTWKKLCKFTTANSLWTKLIFQVWACYCVVFKCLVRTSVSGIPRQIHSGFILPLGLFSWPLSWELSIWSWSLPVSVLVHPCLYSSIATTDLISCLLLIYCSLPLFSEQFDAGAIERDLYETSPHTTPFLQCSSNSLSALGWLFTSLVCLLWTTCLRRTVGRTRSLCFSWKKRFLSAPLEASACTFLLLGSSSSFSLSRCHYNHAIKDV